MLQRVSVRRALGSALLLAALGCRGGDEGWERLPAEPLVLLCVDGLEPGIVRSMLERERLPTIARFAEQGVVGSVETLLPTWSPVIWTTIATGRDKSEHGITFFSEESTGLPFTSNSRQIPALWNLASEAGLGVDVAGYWVTWPAEQINGRMVASYAAQAQASVIWKPGLWKNLSDQTWPPELVDDVAPLITFASDDADALETLFSDFPRPVEPSDQVRRLFVDLAWTSAADRSFTAIAQHFLEHEPGDLVIVYMSLPDVAGHRFWRYFRPDEMGYPVDEDEVRAFGPVMELAYEVTDRALGTLLDRAPNGANVVLVSDHGMHVDIETRNDPLALTSGHHQTAPSGLFAALGPAFARRGSLLTGDDPRGVVGDVRGVAPLALRLVGLPAPEDWPLVRLPNALEDLLEPTWAAEHPRRTRSSPDAAWRAQNPRGLPRDPGGDLDEQFLESMSRLGYFDLPGAAPERE